MMKPTRPARGQAVGPGWLVGGLITALSAASVLANTDVHSPPRFDGAGYAVLAEALRSGRGYREIDHPDAPKHAHFPPGYPVVLAAVWSVTGRSDVVAHWLSVACTLGATIAGWLWLRSLYAPRVAALLALALAVNWTWGRTGGAIQSEPLYFLLTQLALLSLARGDSRAPRGAGLRLGLWLGAATLTRHLGAALAVALFVELMLRRRRRAALSAALAAAALVLPWLGWLAVVPRPNQAGLLTLERLPDRVISQAWFYVQRIPDQLTGPIIEVGTVFNRSAPLALAANAWAAAASGLVVAGWLRALRNPRRRVAALVSFINLTVLVVWPFTEAGRFLIPLVPLLLIGSLEGVAALARCFHVAHARQRAAAMILAASLPYAGYSIATRRAEALRGTHAEFDAACAFLSIGTAAGGPVLTRHPGEVYWQTGRLALEPAGGLERAIDQYRVTHLLVDDERYANAPVNPLADFVSAHPERVRKVWPPATGHSAVSVYEVVPND
jgi:hypothetical protein